MKIRPLFFGVYTIETRDACAIHDTTKRSHLKLIRKRLYLRIVNDRPFETFREMVDSLPPVAVLKAAAIERFMLKEDHGRLLDENEVDDGAA